MANLSAIHPVLKHKILYHKPLFKIELEYKQQKTGGDEKTSIEIIQNSRFLFAVHQMLEEPCLYLRECFKTKKIPTIYNSLKKEFKESVLNTEKFLLTFKPQEIVAFRENPFTRQLKDFLYDNYNITAHFYEELIEVLKDKKIKYEEQYNRDDEDHNCLYAVRLIISRWEA